MTTGYWLMMGDKTTCGGQILEGTGRKKFTGKHAAMNGFKVSCGKHPGVYRIAGGHPGHTMDGNGFASTLYSRSTCPCRAQFIPSVTIATHGFYQGDAPGVTSSAIPADSKPAQYAQAARENGAAEPQHAQSRRKETREITLTLGVFFDGTGNNAVNTDNMLKACTAAHYRLADTDAENILGKCAREEMGITGTGATSYTGYYTSIHWLNTLYKKVFSADSTDIQKDIYVDGIGTEAGKSDSMVGQIFGTLDTGVIAKTDKAVSRVAMTLQDLISTIKKDQPDDEFVVKTLQFDIFGFSRGAAAARHFANRIQAQDPAVISAIRQGMSGTPFNGAPAGKTRFIGLFDTVAAIGTPVNGLNPHSADTGKVNLALRPGVAEKVFHITAAHECRFNFALNSVKPAWPELALPGAHSDIGGGYLPVVKEDLFLTRPRAETVPLSRPDNQTRSYQQAVAQMAVLDAYPSVAPVLRTSVISVETWHDARMPPDRYGIPQKRSFAAMTLRDRVVTNNWSKVVLQVMLDAAQEAGVLFDPVDPSNPNLAFPDELASLCEKARAMGKAVRTGQDSDSFSEDELDVIAGKYIHCSANWNAILADSDGVIRGGASPSEVVGFVNRPDEQWQRTVYNMDGKKL
jgi:uncharacterized Zn-binding protein involved in type VI secretion